MKFLADEDFPKPIISKIRKLGYSVKTIQQKGLRGSSDAVVTEIALKEKRIILTFDKDFLEKEPQKFGLIVFRFPKIPTNEIITLTEKFLDDLNRIKGKIHHQFDKFGLKPIR